MIRFEPDTWQDALLRPIAMIAADGGVYVEIMAPDLRFALVLALIGLHAFFWLRRRQASGPVWPTAVLLLGVAIAFYPWLKTSGNGRYFMAFLVIVGPLCVALVYLLPLTRGRRLALAGFLVATQAFVVYESDPIRSWALGQWRDGPYFELSLPPDLAAVPATYVTLSNISYSLIAPLFPASSSWINIASAPPDREKTALGRRIQATLTSGKPLKLLIPTVPERATPQGLPNDDMVRSITMMLADHRMALTGAAECRMLRSEGLASTAAYKNRAAKDDKFRTLAGFWVCPLRYPVEPPADRPQAAASRFDAVFNKLEASCPRFFRSGEATTRVINGGELRQYFESDMKLYVMDSGAVFYWYYRTFSPEPVGTVEDLMSGKATIDCRKIRGRSGLPWEREI